METDECFEILENAGWFDGWSAVARESARSTIEENRQFRDQDQFPGAAMISAWGDGECVYDEDSYTQIVNEFCNGSHGFFQPTNILEVWTDLGDGDFEIEISFECHSKTYSRTLAYEGDWVDSEIFNLINEAMTESDPPLLFLQPDVGFGQEFGFLLIPASLVPSAIEQELLPPFDQEDETFDEMDDGESPESSEDTLPMILDLFQLSEELEDPEVFEEEWGSLPEHLVHFVRRDLGKFIEAIAAGADINATSSNGLLSPLRIAAYDDFQEGMDWLLGQPGLEIDQADLDGDTALSCAIQEGHHDAVRRLISAGADVHFVNKAGMNLVQFAAKHRNTEMVEFLKGIVSG